MRSWILFHMFGMVFFTVPIVLGLNLWLYGSITWAAVFGMLLGWLIVVVPLGAYHYYNDSF